MTGDTEALIIHLITDIMMVSTTLTGGTVGTEVIDMAGTDIIILTDIMLGALLIITTTFMVTDIVTITMEEDMLLTDLATTITLIEDTVLAEETQ